MVMMRSATWLLQMCELRSRSDVLIGWLDGRREGPRLGVLTEDLHEGIRLELRRGAVPRSCALTGRPGRSHGDLCCTALLLALLHGVAEQSGRLLLLTLREIVGEPAVLAGHLDGVAVEHHLAALQPDRP